MFFLDTNVLILALADKEPEVEILKVLVLHSQLAFSPVVVAEFLVKATKKEQAAIESLAERFGVISIGRLTAEIASFYRREFTRKKRAVFLLDCFLAASCKEHEYGLITNDKKDFPMEDIKVLTPAEFLFESPVKAYS